MKKGQQAQLLREPTFLTIPQVSLISSESGKGVVRGIRVVIDFYPESGYEDNQLFVYIRDKNGDITEFQAETDEADKYAETGEITLDPDKGNFANLMGKWDSVAYADEGALAYPKRELLDRLDRIMVFMDHGYVG